MNMSLQTDRVAPADAPLVSYGTAIRDALRQEMQRDPKVFVFGLDVDDHKGIQGSTIGLLQEFGPERVFGTPLSEDAMTGLAIGAAMAGLRPVHVHIRMDFIMLAMNQLVNMAAKARYMWGGQVQVPMVVRGMIGKSWGQGPQHSQSLYSMFMHVPGLKVVAPSNAYDAKGCMAAAIRDNNPVIFVEHRMLYFTDAYVPTAPYTIEFGHARVVAPGSDITLVGVSHMVLECLRARELLADAGISAEVVDPISLMPLDIATIRRSVGKTRRLLVVDNDWTTCGASAEIIAGVAESDVAQAGVQMKRLGYQPVTCPTTTSLEKHFYPDAITVAETAYAMCKPNGARWTPEPQRAQLAHLQKFRGPF